MKKINVLLVISLTLISIIVHFGCKFGGDRPTATDEKEEKTQVELSALKESFLSDGGLKYEYEQNEESSIKQTFDDFWYEYRKGDIKRSRKYLMSPAKDQLEFNCEIQKSVLKKTEVDYLGETIIEGDDNRNYARIKIELIFPSLEILYPSFMIRANDVLMNNNDDIDIIDKNGLLYDIFYEELEIVTNSEHKTKVTTENVLLKEIESGASWKIIEADFMGIEFPDLIKKAIKVTNNKESILEDNFKNNERLKRHMRDRIHLDLKKVDIDKEKTLKTLIKYPDKVEFYPKFMSNSFNLFGNLRRDIDEDTLKRVIDTAYVNALNEEIGKEYFKETSKVFFCEDEFKFVLKGSPYIKLSDFEYMKEGKELYDFFKFVEDQKLYVDYFLSDLNKERRREVFYIQDEVVKENNYRTHKYKISFIYPDPDYLQTIYLKHFDLKLEFYEEEFSEVVNVLFEEIYKSKEVDDDMIKKGNTVRSLKLDEENGYNYIIDRDDTYPKVGLPFEVNLNY